MTYPTYATLICAAVPLLLIWLAAEFRARPAVRIALGLCTLAAVGGASYFFGSFGPSYELLAYQQSIVRIQQHLDQGESVQVQAALRQARARPPSEGGFGFRLWSALSDSRTTATTR